MQIAMTVAATKVRILQESTLAAMEQQKEPGQTPPADSTCKP